MQFRCLVTRTFCISDCDPRIEQPSTGSVSASRQSGELTLRMSLDRFNPVEGCGNCIRYRLSLENNLIRNRRHQNPLAFHGRLWEDGLDERPLCRIDGGRMVQHHDQSARLARLLQAVVLLVVDFLFCCVPLVNRARNVRAFPNHSDNQRNRSQSAPREHQLGWRVIQFERGRRLLFPEILRATQPYCFLLRLLPDP